MYAERTGHEVAKTDVNILEKALKTMTKEGFLKRYIVC
jgi:hypothetical protein